MGGMECCVSVAQLVRARGEGWFAAPGIVLWRIADINGASFFGRVTHAQLEIAFEAGQRHARAPLTHPFDVVSDLASVTSFDETIYREMSAFIAELVPDVASRVRRHFVIVPDGVLRAAAAGFLHLHTQHPWQIAADLGTAVGESIAARIAAVVDPLWEADLVTALRTHLIADTLPAAAKALGVAPRTLQRALHGAGTTFRALVEESRIAAAFRLLDQTDLKVEAIAREVGFRSLSGFVRSFRRVSGCSPHERRLRRTA